jgi:hypothetical protein
MKGLGAALMLIGLLGLALGGIPYNKTETVAQFGDLKMRATEKRQALPPIVSGAAILVGAAIWFGAGRKPSS